MIRRITLTLMMVVLVVPSALIGQNIRQSYSGKLGFYAPGDGLNNGLMIGADGITEFLRFDFSLNLTADLYFKQSFNFFKDPKPEILRQQIVLLPIHAGAAYKIVDVDDAESRIYVELVRDTICIFTESIIAVIPAACWVVPSRSRSPGTAEISSPSCSQGFSSGRYLWNRNGTLLQETRTLWELTRSSSIRRDSALPWDFSTDRHHAVNPQ